MRVLGSDSLWTSDSRPHHQRVANLLRDLVKAVHDGLLEYVTRPGVELQSSPYEVLDRLVGTMTDEVLSGELLITEYSGTQAADTASSAEFAADPKPRSLSELETHIIPSNPRAFNVRESRSVESSSKKYRPTWRRRSRRLSSADW